jgi:hypothetical protein
MRRRGVLPRRERTLPAQRSPSLLLGLLVVAAVAAVAAVAVVASRSRPPPSPLWAPFLRALAQEEEEEEEEGAVGTGWRPVARFAR